MKQQISELAEIDAAEAPDLADEITARLAADLEAPVGEIKPQEAVETAETGANPPDA